MSTGGSHQAKHSILFLFGILKSFSANAEIVAEVKREEMMVQLSDLSVNAQSTVLGDIAVRLVCKWLKETYPFFEIDDEETIYSDFTLSEPGGASVGVEVKFISHPHHLIPRILNAIKKADTALEHKDNTLDNMILFFVAESKDILNELFTAIFAYQLSNSGLFYSNSSVSGKSVISHYFKYCLSIAFSSEGFLFFPAKWYCIIVLKGLNMINLIFMVLYKAKLV